LTSKKTNPETVLKYSAKPGEDVGILEFVRVTLMTSLLLLLPVLKSPELLLQLADFPDVLPKL
jgi:hypothetical protein